MQQKEVCESEEGAGWNHERSWQEQFFTLQETDNSGKVWNCETDSYEPNLGKACTLIAKDF